jgi:hypothetical protein
MKLTTLAALSLLPAAVLAACAATAQLSVGDPVPYPDGYRDWDHVRSMVIQPGHPLYDSFGGIHHIYANEAARSGLERADGSYADGAVFVFDLLTAESAGGAVTEGARKVVGVMHRDADAFANTGGWGFAGFGGDSRNNVVTDPKQGCFECHTGRESTGYVFSQWRK